MRFDFKMGLTAIKAELKANVDVQAGELRGLYITTIPGQDMVYMEKRIEAELVVADPDLGETLAAAEIPHIAREAVASGVSRLRQGCRDPDDRQSLEADFPDDRGAPAVGEERDRHRYDRRRSTGVR
ncbi:hypothetical protein U8P73_36655 (plasmid) [Rhizobium beringeri]|uniref:hypothetical protein n=1 Tax=Rhizobium beringeri TaxID=3019934 RepID=UPI002DDD39AA|nr:hypothetical protein [Rhizobium beringeri]WSG93504.1 hypothetical protein U8P73_36655 [Rhizobium beringeri]